MYFVILYMKTLSAASHFSSSNEQEPFLWCFTCAAQGWGMGLPGETGTQPQEQGQLLGSLLPWGHWESSPEEILHLQPSENWPWAQPFPSHPSACLNLHPLEYGFTETLAFLRQAQQTPSPISQVSGSVFDFEGHVEEKEWEENSDSLSNLDLPS